MRPDFFRSGQIFPPELAGKSYQVFATLAGDVTQQVSAVGRPVPERSEWSGGLPPRSSMTELHECTLSL